MRIDIVKDFENPNCVGEMVIDIRNSEALLIIRALKYYTDKRKLPFDERMQAGDMARQLSKGIEESVQEIRRQEDAERKKAREKKE